MTKGRQMERQIQREKSWKQKSDEAVGGICGICCLSGQGEQIVSFCAASVSDGCHYLTQWV